MIFDEAPNHIQRFEQAIATAFACRNVIKYNSTLSEEQKNEILADQFLAAIPAGTLDRQHCHRVQFGYSAFTIS